LAGERAAGRTILISSHLLSEVEQTADRVAIMTEGKLVIEATMPVLRDTIKAERRIDVELVENVEGITDALMALPCVLQVREQDRKISIVTAADRDYRVDVSRELARCGAIVQGMREIETTLEEAFLALTDAHSHKGARP
jgi:ABC-2 type transport system ATP-binding protein